MFILKDPVIILTFRQDPDLIFTLLPFLLYFDDFDTMNKILSSILFSIFLFTTNSIGAVAVIANKSVPLDKITKDELLEFYTGETRRWSDGETVVVFDLKPKTELKGQFYKLVGKSSSRMKSIWMVNMLSGEGDPPEAMATEEAMLKKVANTKGAIGFIDQSKVSNEVKVLTIVENKE